MIPACWHERCGAGTSFGAELGHDRSESDMVVGDVATFSWISLRRRASSSSVLKCFRRSISARSHVASVAGPACASMRGGGINSGVELAVPGRPPKSGDMARSRSAGPFSGAPLKNARMDCTDRLRFKVLSFSLPFDFLVPIDDEDL